MTVDFISLAVITLAAFLCPLFAAAIPGKPISETVFLLIVGMVCGPHVLGLVSLSDAVDLLSELGLAFLFLLAGYEIDPKSVIGPDGKRGLATWCVSIVAAFGAVSLWPAFSVNSIDGIAVAIALTTTAIGTLLPILEEREILPTRIGQEVVSYGTWGELAPVLAMTLLLSTRAEWRTILVLVVFLALAVLVAVVPKRARDAGGRVFRFVQNNAETNSQMLVRTVTMLLVGLTALAEIFDLDIVLGAFAAGFILRYVIPEGSEAMEGKLRAIGYGFFIPLFFIVSGAKIDVTAIAANPVLLVVFIALLLVVRALPIYLSLTTSAATRDLGFNEKLTIALYCTTALPLIVAVTTVAVNAGAMTQATSSVLVAAGGITVLLMPLLASLTVRAANADLTGAAREIKEDPHRTAQILRQHRKLELQRHQAAKRAKAEGRAHGAVLGLTEEEMLMLEVNESGERTEREEHGARPVRHRGKARAHEASGAAKDADGPTAADEPDEASASSDAKPPKTS